MISKKIKEYASSATAARQLGMSVASIQKMVDAGELVGVRTHGGHRRIHMASINEYRAAHGYNMSKSSSGVICIMHQGGNLDPMLMQFYDSKKIKILSSPLDLINIKKNIDVLFIDANNEWLAATPAALIESLKSSCTVYIYNSDKLPSNSPLRETNSENLISNEINYQFISGYFAGQKVLENLLLKR